MAADVTGALGGIDRLPPTWVEQVLWINPQPDLANVAEALCSV